MACKSEKRRKPLLRTNFMHNETFIIPFLSAAAAVRHTSSVTSKQEHQTFASCDWAHPFPDVSNLLSLVNNGPGRQLSSAD